MKLLFDQNLSFKLCTRLADVFPDSSQARLLGLDQVDDRTFWQHAKTAEFTLITHDSDFADLVSVLGFPLMGVAPSSRATIYDLLNRGELASVVIGRRRIVQMSLKFWLPPGSAAAAARRGRPRVSLRPR